MPRQVLPAQFYMITRRCTQRQFLLRPDEPTNAAFTYCLIEAALRCQIEVLLPCAMSNHHHTVIYDRHGRCPEFRGAGWPRDLSPGAPTDPDLQISRIRLVGA